MGVEWLREVAPGPAGDSEPVAIAVGEFCNGPLRDDPRRVGTPLGRQLAGYFSARRGAYRVIYRLVDGDPAVYVARFEHRADVYRRR